MSAILTRVTVAPVVGVSDAYPTVAQVRALAAYLAVVPLDAPSDITIGRLTVRVEVMCPHGRLDPLTCERCNPPPKTPSGTTILARGT